MLASRVFFFTLLRLVLFTQLMFFSPLFYYIMPPPHLPFIVVFLPRVDLFNLAVMTAEQEEEKSYDLKSASLAPQTGTEVRSDSG